MFPFDFFILGWSWTVWPGSRENWVAMGNSRGADRAHSAVPRKRWGFRHQPASWCDEATRPPSQLSQIHGHFSPSAHLLFTLQWLYLGPGQTGLSVPNLRMCGPQALSRVHHDKVFWSQRTDKVWRCKQKPSYYILLICSNPNWHEAGHFYPHVILELDFLAEFESKNSKLFWWWKFTSIGLVWSPNSLSLIKVAPRSRQRWEFFLFSELMPIRVKGKVWLWSC